MRCSDPVSATEARLAAPVRSVQLTDLICSHACCFLSLLEFLMEGDAATIGVTTSLVESVIRQDGPALGMVFSALFHQYTSIAHWVLELGARPDRLNAVLRNRKAGTAEFWLNC